MLEERSSNIDLPRESLIENALSEDGKTLFRAIGGYGELTYTAERHRDPVVDLRRLVLYFGHHFDEHWRLYLELELAHAVASSSNDLGEFEVEQAFIDRLVRHSINFRVGLVLPPVGIVNTYHEPPTFNGVDRPDVDSVIIPTTWREPGVGIFGEPTRGLRYQLFLVNGFNATRFSARAPLRDGVQQGQLANGRDFGVVGRLDYEPSHGTIIGASAYGGSSGNTLTSSVGRVPVGMFDIDARVRAGHVTARGQLAVLMIGDTAALNQALGAGTPAQMDAGPVPSRAWGGYAEIGYDFAPVIAPTTYQELVAFARLDHVDPQAAVHGGVLPRTEFRRTAPMVGLVWHPLSEIAFKLDYCHYWLGDSTQGDRFATAVTWRF